MGCTWTGPTKNPHASRGRLKRRGSWLLRKWGNAETPEQPYAQLRPPSNRPSMTPSPGRPNCAEPGGNAAFHFLDWRTPRWDTRPLLGMTGSAERRVTWPSRLLSHKSSNNDPSQPQHSVRFQGIDGEAESGPAAGRPCGRRHQEGNIFVDKKSALRDTKPGDRFGFPPE
jgi:hypothetical protein